VWKPVVCAVNGLVNGGGLHFVTDCDIVIASETAMFMDSHVNVGQVGALENIGVARRSTLGAALLMTLVGRSYRMSAARAYQLGLVDLLEPTAEAAVLKAKELASIMLENSPQAMALSKRAIWATTEMSSEKAIDYGWELVKSHWSHPDYEEGPKAFIEKRKAQWIANPDARR
jgi:enoyl-CoA hydratase/carnithine racemase